MAAGCPPMAWGVVMLHADEVPHRRQRCQVLDLSQSPFSSVSPWPPPAPGTPLGSTLYNPGGALQPGIQHPAPRPFSCCHRVAHSLIHKHNGRTQTGTGDKLRAKKRWETGLRHRHSLPTQQTRAKTLANNHTQEKNCSQRPPTILRKTLCRHPEDLPPSFGHPKLSTKSETTTKSFILYGLPLEVASSAAPAELVAPGWRNEVQSERNLKKQEVDSA